tara:strand:- start:5661 stop:5915 length:255 start_codon:yes stop_codon:yes gene_type:complete
MIGSAYNVLRNFGYTYDKYDKEKHCYIKENVSIFVMDVTKGTDITYECSVYVDDVFYENSHTDQQLTELLTVLGRDEKIDKLTK